VVAVGRDPDDLALVRAALHLVGLPVRAEGSLDSVGPAAVLVVYDAAVPAHSPDDRRALADLRAWRVPLLCISDAPQPLVPDETLRRPFTPLDLLGAASRAQPRLYDYCPAEHVEPDLEDNLLLVTHDLRRATEDADRSLAQAAVALVDILRLRDIETAMHCYRVYAYARTLAEIVAPEVLEDHTTALGFLLHDIGKLALPDAILHKPGPLTARERQLMQTHPVIGAETAGRFLAEGGGLDVIRHHHERWDGSGYPDRLAGSKIPVEARIFAAADALDALTSNRPYRPARQWRAALGVLERDGGTHFDPAVVAALLEHESALYRLRGHSSQIAREPQAFTNLNDPPAS
jgi:ribonuclease P protein subunit RPR2